MLSSNEEELLKKQRKGARLTAMIFGLIAFLIFAFTIFQRMSN